MVSSATKRCADLFQADALSLVRDLPRSVVESWPDDPLPPPFDLAPPTSLSEYRFSLRKSRLPNGEVWVTIQRYRKYRFWGYELAIRGFVRMADGTTRPLTKKEEWALG